MTLAHETHSSYICAIKQNLLTRKCNQQ